MGTPIQGLKVTPLDQVASLFFNGPLGVYCKRNHRLLYLFTSGFR
jgi:hypothetical protein